MFVALFLLSSCANSDATKVASAEAKEEDQVIPVVEDFGPEEFEGLVDVRSYSKEIYVDLKYATEDNFMSFPLRQNEESLSSAGCSAASGLLPKLFKCY